MKLHIHPEHGYPYWLTQFDSDQAEYEAVDITGSLGDMVANWMGDAGRFTALPFDMIQGSREKGRYWQMPYDLAGIIADRIGDYPEEITGSPRAVELLAAYFRRQFAERESPYSCFKGD